ncbi:MAG: penicillin-binding transpeptidase domain-containing protein [Gemmatimonadaceae bacterium]
MNRSRRIGIVHASLALLMLAVLGKAAQVQLIQGRAWSDLANRQHFTDHDIPAPRGEIFDASGRTLAMSRDLVRLEVAPGEVRAPRKLRDALLAAGVPHATAARVVDKNRPWLVIPGRFVAKDVASITAMRGVYPTAVSERAYAATPALRALLGSVNTGSRGVDGLELALDSLLTGTAGASRLVRDFRSRGVASPTHPGEAARPGHSVTLTINHELQDIAERTLADAVARMEAQGGDIVILDPRDGAVLAIAGQRDGRSASVTAITEPFEPGSTLKPLIVAGLLGRGKAKLTDQVPARGGSYQLHGRTVNDEPHAEPTPPMLSLADVVRLSSNVGMVQFAERFEPREQFETLRDFGLGTPTGVPYSSEASGTLRPPAAWSKQSSASLSLGYEVAVTPMQLALAYAAIANGGELLEPSLIKEIRAPGGTVVFSHERRVVRRVISRKVAASVRDLLGGVVERGTAVDADLASYALAGKTGTPRRAIDGRYAPMQYNPNFVGLFPAEAPQLVVVVKLTSPKGNFYGGHTAAPMTKTIVQAALAARDAALDRSALSARQPKPDNVRLARQPSATRAARTDEAGELPVDSSGGAPASVTLDLPAKASGSRPAQSPRRVPNVEGLSLRDAVRSLHSAGFRVQLVRDAAASSRNLTEPAQGMTAMSGSVVRLRYSR